MGDCSPCQGDTKYLQCFPCWLPLWGPSQGQQLLPCHLTGAELGSSPTRWEVMLCLPSIPTSSHPSSHHSPLGRFHSTLGPGLLCASRSLPSKDSPSEHGVWSLCLWGLLLQANASVSGSFTSTPTLCAVLLVQLYWSPSSDPQYSSLEPLSFCSQSMLFVLQTLWALRLQPWLSPLPPEVP